MKDIGKSPPTFSDAAVVANQIMSCGYEFDSAELFFNHFRWVSRQSVLEQFCTITMDKFRISLNTTESPAHNNIIGFI